MRAVQIGTDYVPESKEYRLMEVVFDEVSRLEASPLALPWSENRVLDKIMSSFLDSPTNNQSIEQWADFVHSTPRTLARLFKKEVNMTFTEWRMRVRLFYAIEKLYQGISVTSIALDLGYSTPSSFIVAFCKVLGKSPLEYMAKEFD